MKTLVYSHAVRMATEQTNRIINVDTVGPKK